MAEFTKEQLREHLDMRLTHTRKAVQENTGTGWAEFYEKEVSVLEIALAALTAGMEQEPEGWQFLGVNGLWVSVTENGMRQALKEGCEVRPLYAAPQLPQPAVVDADDNFYSWFCREWDQYYQPNQYSTSAKQHLGAIAESAWFACRTAMLQGGK